jgi:NitT/TauT family transport system permease protein
MTRPELAPLLWPALTGICALAAWQGATAHWHINPVILPAPIDVVQDLRRTWSDLLYQARFTGTESVVACGLSGLFGALVAALLASSKLLREMLMPNLVLFQLVPKIALAPVFVVWLGIDAPSRLVFSVFISFFPVALGTLTGLLDTERNALLLCRSLGAAPWQTFLHVRIPYAVPFFFSGMKVAATLSVIGIVIGEFISSRHGLGSVILLAGSRAETPQIFAALAMLCVIGLAIYGVIAGLEARLRRGWQG